METIQDFFICDRCGAKDFTLVYSFSLRFHGVNFSDDLIYDRVTEEFYQCVKCHTRYASEEIERGLMEYKKKRISRKSS